MIRRFRLWLSDIFEGLSNILGYEPWGYDQFSHGFREGQKTRQKAKKGMM